MTRKKRRKPQDRVYRERSSPEKGAGDKLGFALLRADENGNVSEEEIDRFMRELGLPEAKD
jgi:hypothetical protein